MTIANLVCASKCVLKRQNISSSLKRNVLSANRGFNRININNNNLLYKNFLIQRKKFSTSVVHFKPDNLEIPEEKENFSSFIEEWNSFSRNSENNSPPSVEKFGEIIVQLIPPPPSKRNYDNNKSNTLTIPYKDMLKTVNFKSYNVLLVAVIDTRKSAVKIETAKESSLVPIFKCINKIRSPRPDENDDPRYSQNRNRNRNREYNNNNSNNNKYNKKEKEKRKKSEKTFEIGWKISDEDLYNNRGKLMVKALNSGNKVVVYLGKNKRGSSREKIPSEVKNELVKKVTNFLSQHASLQSDSNSNSNSNYSNPMLVFEPKKKSSESADSQKSDKPSE